MESIGSGVCTKQPLVKQKHKLAERFSDGKIKEVEQAILKAATFPGALGSYTVDLASDISKYQVVFDAGSEKFEKTLPTLAKVNQWLLSMTIAYKKGELHKNSKAVEKSSKPAVELAKAADALGSADLHTEMKGFQSDSICPSNGDEEVGITDVTANILQVQKLAVVPLKPSTINVHRGSFVSFMKLAANYTSEHLGGILLGKVVWNGKFHVTQIVLTTEPIETLLHDDKIKSVCSGMQLRPCGFIVKGNAEDWHCKALDSLSYFSNCNHPLIICADFSSNTTGDVCALELNTEAEDDVCAVIPEIDRVSLTWTTQPHDHKRRLTYNMCWLKDFSQSHVEKATISICEAVVAHVCNNVLNGKQQTDTGVQVQGDVSKKKMILVATPADGMCGWYSLIASTDVKSYAAIPRETSGYPTNRSMQKVEEDNAKELHSLTCADALANCETKFHAAIRRVQQNPAFDPLDLEWIHKVVSVSIRCTCSQEACVPFFLKLPSHIRTKQYLFMSIAHVLITIPHWEILHLEPPTKSAFETVSDAGGSH